MHGEYLPNATNEVVKSPNMMNITGIAAPVMAAANVPTNNKK